MSGLPLNIQMAQEAYRDRLKALRDERAGALYGETDPNLQIGPDEFDPKVQGIARPAKAEPAANSKAAAAKAKAENAKAGRKLIKEDVKAKRKVTYPRKDYGTITIPVPRYTAAGQEQFGLTQATRATSLAMGIIVLPARTKKLPRSSKNPPSPEKRPVCRMLVWPPGPV